MLQMALAQAHALMPECVHMRTHMHTPAHARTHAQCHRTKCPTVDFNVIYRENFPSEGKQQRVGEEFGMFVVTDMLARLKDRNMLQLGNTVIVLLIGCFASLRWALSACYREMQSVALPFSSGFLQAQVCCTCPSSTQCQEKQEMALLYIGLQVTIWPVEGYPNTFRAEIAPSKCVYCEQFMESGEKS